jgi:hypothetical protein
MMVKTAAGKGVVSGKAAEKTKMWRGAASSVWPAALEPAQSELAQILALVTMARHGWDMWPAPAPALAEN